VERDPAKAASLESWLHRIKEAFGPRILGVSQAVAEEWGKMNAKETPPPADGFVRTADGGGRYRCPQTKVWNTESSFK
jgi:hypothetical protein